MRLTAKIQCKFNPSNHKPHTSTNRRTTPSKLISMSLHYVDIFRKYIQRVNCSTNLEMITTWSYCQCPSVFSAIPCFGLLYSGSGTVSAVMTATVYSSVCTTTHQLNKPVMIPKMVRNVRKREKVNGNHRTVVGKSVLGRHGPAESRPGEPKFTMQWVDPLEPIRPTRRGFRLVWSGHDPPLLCTVRLLSRPVDD